MSGDRLFRSIAHRLAGEGSALADEGRLPSFDRATGWLNSGPLAPADLAGRVVLAGFGTYTCVNWLRTLPYLRAWNATYSRSGLALVGVHTPEFGFERDIRNVTRHVDALDIEFPVAVDSDYGIWNEFANHYWPAVYLADANGRLRYHHFGEGEYEMTEMAIQQLLGESGRTDVPSDLVAVEPTGLEVAADWSSLRSPETYIGYGRSDSFASEDSELYDRPHDYPGDRRLPLNSWDLRGRWTVTSEAAVLDEAGGRIRLAFHARDVNLVMAPGDGGDGIPFRMALHGEPVDDAGVVDTPGTYQLLRQHNRIVDRVVEIEFLRAGVRLYCFTFG